MTPAEFKLRYTQFSTELDARIQLYLNEASLLISEEVYGEVYPKVQGLITAHQLTVDNAITTSGSTGTFNTVTSEKAGDVSYSVDSSLVKEVMDNPFKATQFGQEYLYYLRRFGIGAITV